MNILLFEPHEIESQGHLTLAGRRNDHLLQILKVKPGDTLRAGVLNGAQGTATVCAIQDGQVRLSFSPAGTPPLPHVTDLILALPRPIMLKRVLNQAAALGTRRIFIIRSQRVEKSFFQSTLLEPGEIRNHLLAGLEQGLDTRLPEVSIHHRFRPFMEDVLPELADKGSVRLLAHPGESRTLADLTIIKPEQRVLFAIGPEGGWVDHEVERLHSSGFTPFSLGPRILRVDTVLPYLFGQMDMLRMKIRHSAPL